jgi:RNA polymerase sigma-70 factor (sigma-E family)
MEPAGKTAPETATFEAFYRRAYPGAVRLAWLLTHDASLCEDVVQDAFGRLHPRFPSLDRPDAYLRTTIVNGCRERHRRTSREQRRLRLVHAGVERHVAAPTDPLVDALHRLPEHQRAALVLRYWSDLPEAEIAEVLGVRPSTVRSLLARGLEALRKELPR